MFLKLTIHFLHLHNFATSKNHFCYFLQLTYLFKLNSKGRPEDNDKNTLTGTEVGRSHGPGDKGLHPELGGREGRAGGREGGPVTAG